MLRRCMVLLLAVLLLSGPGYRAPLSTVNAGTASIQADPPPYLAYLPGVYRSFSFLPTRLGPFLGRVLGVGRDAADPSILYAMTFGSGVYKSIDAGQSWWPASAGISYLTLQSMAVDPVTPGTVYAGTYGSDTAPYVGVFKTSDGGATWRPTGEMANVWSGVRYNRPVVYALAVDPLNPKRVFAGTRMKSLPSGSLGGGGVFRSENGGATWKPVNSGLPYEDLYIYDLAIDADHPGRVYAALHEHGLYRSDDYGSNWYSLSGTPYAGRSISVDPRDSATLYFGAVKKLGLHRSSDAGLTWTQIDGGGWDSLVAALTPDPYHPGRVYAGILVNNTDYYLMRSTNRGDSWKEVARLNTWGKMVFAPSGQTQFIGVDFDGPYRSTDSGLTWERSAAGLSGFSVTGLVQSPAARGTLYAALYGMGVYTSKDGGASWRSTSAGLDNPGVLALAVDPNNASLLYAATDQSAVYRSTNGGQSWGVLSGGYPRSSEGTRSSAAGASLSGDRPFSPLENLPLPVQDDLSENPDEPALLSRADALAGAASPDLMMAPAGLASANTIAVSPHSSAQILVGTAGRGIYRLDGATWVASSVSSAWVSQIIFDGAVPGRALAAVGAESGGVLDSADGGRTWKPSNTGLAGRTVYSLAQSAADPVLFFAGTDSGVYLSATSGRTWIPMGLPGQAVRAVGVLSLSRDVLFAGTDAAGYYYNLQTGEWVSLQSPLEKVGIQGILPDPAGAAAYFFTRLGGIIRMDVR